MTQKGTLYITRTNFDTEAGISAYAIGDINPLFFTIQDIGIFKVRGNIPPLAGQILRGAKIVPASLGSVECIPGDEEFDVYTRDAQGNFADIDLDNYPIECEFTFPDE